MALRSHLLGAARFGPYRNSELSYAEELWPHVPEQPLVMVDRAYLSAPILLPLESGNDRHWLTRAKSTTACTFVESLGPGDHLVDIQVSWVALRKNPSPPKICRVRVIHYQRPATRRSGC